MKISLFDRSEYSPQEREALSRLRQLLLKPFVMHASLIRHRRVCGKKNCACADDEAARHVNWYIVQSRKGKQRMKYVAPTVYPRVHEWVRHYWEARTLLDKLSECSWKRFKALPR